MHKSMVGYAEAGFAYHISHDVLQHATPLQIAMTTGPHACRLQAEELLVHARIASGHCQDAAAAAHALLANCRAHGQQASAASAQLACAKAYHAAQQPTLALPHALNAAYHATALHLDALAVDAAVAIAEIKLDMSADWGPDARRLVQVWHIDPLDGSSS